MGSPRNQGDSGEVLLPTSIYSISKPIQNVNPEKTQGTVSVKTLLKRNTGGMSAGIPKNSKTELLTSDVDTSVAREDSDVNMDFVKTQKTINQGTVL